MTRDVAVKTPHRRLVIVPGFLTERGALSKLLRGSSLDHLDPTATIDERAWLNAAQVSTAPDVSVEVLSWTSQSLFRMLSEVLAPLINRSFGLGFPGRVDAQLLRAAFNVKEVWNDAVTQSEEAVQQLVRVIETSPEDESLYLLGHSLGGRIVLKALMNTLGDRAHLRSSRWVPRASVWAPAIAQREVNWALLRAAPHPPEILFSQTDLVLKLCFPFGQAAIRDFNLRELLKVAGPLFDPTQHAVGLKGPQGASGLAYAPQLDLSDQRMTHIGYLWAFEALMCRSAYLAALSPQRQVI